MMMEIRNITPVCKFCEHYDVLRNGRSHCVKNKAYVEANDMACDIFIRY